MPHLKSLQSIKHGCQPSNVTCSPTDVSPAYVLPLGIKVRPASAAGAALMGQLMARQRSAPVQQTRPAVQSLQRDCIYLQAVPDRSPRSAAGPAPGVEQDTGEPVRPVQSPAPGVKQGTGEPVRLVQSPAPGVLVRSRVQESWSARSSPRHQACWSGAGYRRAGPPGPGAEVMALEVMEMMEGLDGIGCWMVG